MDSFRNAIGEDCCIEICLLVISIPSECRLEYATSFEVRGTFTSITSWCNVSGKLPVVVVFFLYRDDLVGVDLGMIFGLTASEDSCVVIPV